MAPHFDAIVIGSGLGGLTAAALYARTGRRAGARAQRRVRRCRDRWPLAGREPLHAGPHWKRAGFADLKISAHDSMTQEGTGHAGMATLIDLVGRK
jgi:flavin-dependent dehydrogenase